MKVLNNPVFPIHPTTFEGIATDVLMADKPYKIVHANEACVLSVVFEEGELAVDFTLSETEDVSLPVAFSVSSDTIIKVS